MAQNTSGENIIGANQTGTQAMPLTLDFRETIRERIEQEPGFREAFLEEGVECLLGGDLEAGKAVLRAYIHATMGFRMLGSLTNKSPRSLVRMLDAAGNPQARDLLKIVRCIQEREGLHMRAQAIR